MPFHGSALDNLRIANPCPAAWESMEGDERVRSCVLCSRKVYNLSAMARTEAEALVAQTSDRICVRLYRRADGMVMTQDCPSIQRRRRKWQGLTILLAIAFLVTLSLSFVLQSRERPDPGTRFIWLRGQRPFKDVLDWIDPPPPPGGMWVVGW
jgi:hypothetical protein